MGLLNSFFKSKKQNFFENITAEIANEERKKVLLKNISNEKLPLTLDQEGIFCFVLATFYFELNFNPLLKGAILKKEYQDLLERIKNSQDFIDIYDSMLEFNKPNLNVNNVSWNFSTTYLQKAWKIEKEMLDIILLTGYSFYLTQIRSSIKKRIANSINEIVIRTNLHN